MIHQRHRQTDRQTDRWTDDMRSQDRTLHYSASRGKNCMQTRNGHTDDHDILFSFDLRHTDTVPKATFAVSTFVS